MVFVELPLTSAMEEVFGRCAEGSIARFITRLRSRLGWLMGACAKLLARQTSALRVQGLAHMIATPSGTRRGRAETVVAVPRCRV
jgi:hypothetical protein